MVNIDAMMQALPAAALEPSLMAIINGLVPEDRQFKASDAIYLMEPPAGQRVPYVEPISALTTLFRHRGVLLPDAKTQASEWVVRMHSMVGDDRWAVFYDCFDASLPPHVPVPDFVACMRKLRLVPPELIDFIEMATAATITASSFHRGDYSEAPWSLNNPPTLPSPKAMIEFVPGQPWNDREEGPDWKSPDNPFICWRESMRPIAQKLEHALGEPVYRFADLDDDLDDDDVHRFLVLHWCCTWKPDSPFVRHLVKVSGASGVDELKAALIDPASYTHPFEMNESFLRAEAGICRIDYVPPDVRKTVVVVFRTMQACAAAEALLSQQIGAEASIVAPPELATDDWTRRATPHCRGWLSRYPFTSLDADQGRRGPLEILALADEVCVIGDEPMPKQGFDLRLTPAVEDLLWLAFELGLDARYYDVRGIRHGNPDACLKRRDAPERVAAQRARRISLTQQLTEIRLDCDWSSSGLWNEKGQMLAYDLLDLPFPLVRRIAAWQRDFDETLNPPDDMGDDAWWGHHQREKFDIAKVLQDVVGNGIAVKLFRDKRWIAIAEIDGEDRGDS